MVLNYLFNFKLGKLTEAVTNASNKAKDNSRCPVEKSLIRGSVSPSSQGRLSTSGKECDWFSEMM